MNPASPHIKSRGTTRQSGNNVDNELSENRNRFAGLLLDAISAGALLLSPEGKVLLANRAAESLIGRSTGELTGQRLVESIPGLSPQMQKKLSDEIAQSAAGEPSQCEIECEIEFEAPGAAASTVLDFRFQSLPALSGPNSPILAEVHDVSSGVCQRTSDEAHYSEADILDSSEDAIIRNDLNGTIQSWNPAAASLFGYSAEEIIGQPIMCLMPGELHAEEKQIMSRIRAGERLDHFETTRLAKNGKRLSLSIAISPVRDASGNIVGASRIARDTSERRRLDDARFRLAAIVESTDDAIASKDLNGIVTSWNRAAERLFGYTAEEMIGQPITKIIPAELLTDEDRILATIAGGERIDHFETTRLRKDGETVDVSLTISPVRDETGKIIGAAKIARDITQQKCAERALRTSERLASVGRLAATVAHEINNPLEAVTNLIFLARHSQSKEEIQKYLSMVEEELERISHLTRQTLGFYRETKGVARVRLGEIVESLLSVFGPRMRNKGIKVSSEIDNDIEIIAVPGEIRQVVANLLSNSIDALDVGGEICLRISPAAQWDGARTPGVRLTIGDTGPGIPSEVRPRLFEPFFTTKKDVGTGLGLWVCKSIVENHGGSIQVRSNTIPGKSGTTFSVFLPTPAPGMANNFPEPPETDSISRTA